MTQLTVEQEASLVAAAVEARRHAYAKYSNLEVGAAVLTATGEIFRGCNVENVSFGLTICAERVALATAAAAGYREIEALAVATPHGTLPCGACRQFMCEFADNMHVLLVNVDQNDSVERLQLRDLLPRPFRHIPNSSS